MPAPVPALDGRVAAVAGGGAGIGRAISLALADHGAAVGVVGPAGTEPAVAEEITASGGRATAVVSRLDRRSRADAALAQVTAELGPLDVFVHALADPDGLKPAALAETDEDGWDRRCEAQLRVALACLQAAHAQLRGRGGRVVMVTPTIALTGAAGLAPYATAVEGQRGLAKAAARRWGADAITVNCVAPPVELMAGDPGPGPSPALGQGALHERPDPRRDVGAAVALLAGDLAAGITGMTLPVDGGVWMMP